MEELQMELENRIRNLVWTVCGDYTMEVKPDVESFLSCRPAGLYDSVKQGAFARFFDREALSLYPGEESVPGSRRRRPGVLVSAVY